MLETIMAHTSTHAAQAACSKSREYGARKLDFKWTAEKRKYIKFA
jgi:hypothetical protein